MVYPINIDVRTLYIKFICCLLESTDPNVKRNALQTKDLVSGVLKGLLIDVYETVDYFLTVLKHVIDDQSISRSIKISFFNNYVLDQIAKLYSRNNQLDTIATPLNCNLELKPTVALLAHKFLIHLTTIPGQGVCFQDAGYYLPIKNQTNSSEKVRVYNSILSRFIINLNPLKDLESELLLSILESCPELVSMFL